MLSKNIWVISIVIGIIIFIRCIFDNDENIIYIIGGINIVAIVYVVCTIIEKILNGIISKIDESGDPRQIRKRETRKIKIMIWSVCTVLGALIIGIYFSVMCSSLGNDIISILALGISVLDDDIVKNAIEICRI